MVDLGEAERHFDRADAEVHALCATRRRWTMTIPAEPDRDSDLVIGAALADGRALVAEVKALRAERDAYKAALVAIADVPANEDDECPWCLGNLLDEVHDSRCAAAIAIAPLARAALTEGVTAHEEAPRG